MQLQIFPAIPKKTKILTITFENIFIIPLSLICYAFKRRSLARRSIYEKKKKNNQTATETNFSNHSLRIYIFCINKNKIYLQLNLKSYISTLLYYTFSQVLRTHSVPLRYAYSIYIAIWLLRLNFYMYRRINQ